MMEEILSNNVVEIKMVSDDKSNALEAASGQIEKAFGKGSVMRLGQNPPARQH